MTIVSHYQYYHKGVPEYVPRYQKCLEGPWMKCLRRTNVSDDQTSQTNKCLKRSNVLDE